MKLTSIKDRASAPPSWPSAGIVDARAFSIGESDVIHDPTHYGPNRVRGKCGVVAPIVETDRPRAVWRAFVPNCPTCLAK